MKDKKGKILIIEDEQAVLAGLVDLFVFHGYEVRTAIDGVAGLKLALHESPDLIILDVMLPAKDGFQVCNEIREKDPKTPIIMLTAKSSEEDLLHGLTLGADDYIAKPFSVRELLLRTEAVLRRTMGFHATSPSLQIGKDLIIDTANLTGTQAGQTKRFTRREIELLQHLLDNSQRPVSRDELLDVVWGYGNASQIETRTVDIHIAKLRRKIESDHKQPKLLVTIRGEGYKLMV